MCKKQCYHRAVLYTIKEGRERKRKGRERQRDPSSNNETERTNYKHSKSYKTETSYNKEVNTCETVPKMASRYVIAMVELRFMPSL